MASEHAPNRGSRKDSFISNIARADERISSIKLAHQESMRPLQDELSRLQREKKDLAAQTDREISAEKASRMNAAAELVRDLQDPHCPEHPITRVALLLPQMGQESLADTETLTAAQEIERQFFDLNEHLETSDEPLPFVLVTYQPSRTPGWYGDLHLSYGHTSPFEGLKPHPSEVQSQDCPCGQTHHQLAPALELSVRSFSGVKPSVYSHEYFTSDDKLVSVNGYRTEKDVPRPDSFFAGPKNAIILPKGRIFTEGAEPLVQYDSEEGIKGVRASSRSSMLYEQKTFCAIGPASVEQALEALAKGSAATYQNNEHMIDMFADVNSLVINGLRLAAR